MRETESRERRELVALHIKEMRKLLQRLNLLEKFKKGEVTCFFCNKTLTFSNIGAIMYREGRVVFICDSHTCIKKAFTSQVKEVESGV